LGEGLALLARHVHWRSRTWTRRLEGMISGTTRGCNLEGSVKRVPLPASNEWWGWCLPLYMVEVSDLEDFDVVKGCLDMLWLCMIFVMLGWVSWCNDSSNGILERCKCDYYMLLAFISYFRFSSPTHRHTLF
jgi:hypothetical protein